ncbi:hypothetical protein U737_15850 [Methylomonas sp. LW13]|nr:hypothetical protein CWO84_22400 [Methylomonas sp. Kb3]QBC28249.1 hypothetical protein U737_15850 [Methylomonas sp. LW13]
MRTGLIGPAINDISSLERHIVAASARWLIAANLNCLKRQDQNNLKTIAYRAIAANTRQLAQEMTSKRQPSDIG